MQRIPLATRRVALHRVEEALREIGVLLVVLAPLDGAFSNSAGTRATVLKFLAFGVLCFVSALLLETGRQADG